MINEKYITINKYKQKLRDDEYYVQKEWNNCEFYAHSLQKCDQLTNNEKYSC